MVTVELKGIHTVRAKGNIYYYAWRGGPRLDGQPGTAAFMASYNEAIASRMEPESGRFRSIITHYKATEFKKLADSTKRVWTPWIDRISEYFGNLSIAQFNRA
ncbi:MAG: site-specific integrase, partial [Rhizobium oryzihabitans]